MKVLSDNHGLVDFAIGLVNSVQESTVQIILQKYCMTNWKHLMDSNGPKDVLVLGEANWLKINQLTIYKHGLRVESGLPRI